MITVAWLLGAALSASAHEIYPIKPVRATLKLEPDRIVADLQADSIYWIEEVTQLRPMPVANWPAKTRADVEAYVNAHFPGTRYTIRLTIERRLQRGRNATLVELGTVF